MKLLKARVENFKSVEDSGEFTVDDVTCLVGKNEAGKTALLEALYRINPVEQGADVFNEEEFPRRFLSTYRERQKQDPATAVTTSWELSDSDVEAVNEELGYKVLKSHIVTVSKGYYKGSRWNVKINEASIVRHHLENAELDAVEKSPLANVPTTWELSEKLRSIETPTEKQAALLQQLEDQFPKGDLRKAVYTLLGNRLPHFVFFSSYYQLPGRIGLRDLTERIGNRKLEFGHKVFLSLLSMTSTGLEDIEEINRQEQLVMELESVEARLTDEIKAHISQISRMGAS